MKRVFAACVLISLAVGFAVWSGYVFESEMDYLEASLNGLINLSESCTDEKLAEETEKIVFQWQNVSSLLHSVVLHDGIDELEKKIISLPSIIEHSGREELRTECIEALSIIKILETGEKINFENVFINIL